MSSLVGDLDAAIDRAAAEQPEETWAARWAEVRG